ncbi:serine hydrolase [Fulvimarina sp. MAC3]|uniref:serine hydrolase domain-containing protein n=1 Tax=Fulvimarina sp. MAC3 TaxID=3148887 RepID=UPI0031FC12D7
MANVYRSIVIRSAVPVIGLAIAVSSIDHAVARDKVDFRNAIERAGSFETIETLLIAIDGETVVAEGFSGHSPDRPENIKSASKSIISALVGIAIEKGFLEGPDQTIAPLLKNKLPDDPDPRIFDITIGNLLSMQAGLERTSGGNYGGWIASRDWVENALARPFETDPGGRMLYSTGSTHLLSAILTRETGRSTLDLANDWLGPAGVRITSWERDPQGIYLGGNQMAMTPRSLLAFGELYRNDGRTENGEEIIPEDWIATSWTERTVSRWHDGRYGYGWFIDGFGGEEVAYGWGYGGQMIYVVPDLDLTVAITSDETRPSGGSGYVRDLHRLIGEEIIPAVRGQQAASEEIERVEEAEEPVL